jgi:hypothetical protein
MLEQSLKKWYNNRRNGYITLLSVLVVGAVGVAITVSLILLGLGSARTSLAWQQLHQAKALANACAEEALEQIREVTAFTGSGNLSLGLGSCTYIVASQGGENRTIVASGTADTAVRKVNITITAINPLIIVSSWQEIP